MLSGIPFAHEVDFSTGLPTGAVVYSVLGNDGLALTGLEDVSIPMDGNTLSVIITVPASANYCNKPLFETRTLVWSYPTADGITTGRYRYRVEREIPFPVTEDGVRSKLGVEAHELEDRDINLLLAYGTLVANYPNADLDDFASSGNFATLVVVNAIEAQAALDVLPSLQLAVAKAEDSGTNKYQRFGTIDWDALATSLGRSIMRLDDQMGVSNEILIGSIFVAAGRRVDPVTNVDYV